MAKRKTWAIVLTSWICFTFIIGLVLLTVRPLAWDWDTITAILILYLIPTLLTIGEWVLALVRPE